MHRLPNSAKLIDAARSACEQAGPAHDWLHVRRVTATTRSLCDNLDIDDEIAVAAALLHELVNLPKHHPESRRSGDLCAEAAQELLLDVGWSVERASRVSSCIRDHAFSKGSAPSSPEAAVLQDADRLDAIGAIGVARCMATCTEMDTPFYAEDDPFCTERVPNDRRYGVDHFFKKLLRIQEGLHTQAARTLATRRTSFLRSFLHQLDDEIHGRT